MNWPMPEDIVMPGEEPEDLSDDLRASAVAEVFRLLIEDLTDTAENNVIKTADKPVAIYTAEAIREQLRVLRYAYL